MLVVPKGTALAQHNDAKQALVKHFNAELEKILNANKHQDQYWIIGKVKFPKEHGGKVGRVHLEPCSTKPPLVKESFVYEVDNRRGVKTLLWVMHTQDRLSLPTIGKTISVAG